MAPFCRPLYSFRPLALRLLATCVVAACIQCGAAKTVAAEVPVQLKPDGVLCFTTQWYPESIQQPDEIENPLIRELVRQEILVVAREEFGHVTRDATLGEPFPGFVAGSLTADQTNSEAANTVDLLALDLDVSSTGKWEAVLFVPGPIRQEPIWVYDGTFNFDRPTLYAQLATQLSDLSVPIAKAMRASGAAGEPKKLNPANKPGDEVETLLTNMNFVSQYSAVRAAHAAIAEKGPSNEWLSVLVRGYANLSMLTDHFWSSQHDAFAARSLLYAERMIRISDNQPLAHWNRAYAQAIIGMDVPAIEELKSLTAADAASGGEKQAAALPAWTELVSPYVKFDLQKLEQIATAHPELKEETALLRWDQYRSYQHGPLIYEKGQETIATCPEAYGVYSVMSNWPGLAISRSSVAWGVRAFNDFLPKRIASLADVPASVKDIAKSQPPQGIDGPSEVPIAISRAFVQSTRDEKAPTECTWSILGGLIAEEQFTHAANLMHVEQDATEHSQDALIEQLMPLVEGHRYAAYIRSYADDKGAIAEALGGMQVYDPSVNMRHMFARGWRIPMTFGKTGGDLAWRALWATDLTYQARREAYYRMVADWSGWVKSGSERKFVDALAAMNPESPQAARLQWEYMEEPTTAKLTPLEAKLKDDPGGWYTLGIAYETADDHASAERCFKRSLALSPSYACTERLAQSYLNEGDKKRWRETLEGAFKIPDLGLSSVHIYQLLADESISERNWHEAEAPALKAAESYSGSALELASTVYEGLGEWKKSEYFITQAAQSYPSSYMGSQWYFWCRRTGRGNVEEARTAAVQSIQGAESDTSPWQLRRAFVYRLLDGDGANGMTDLEQKAAWCKSEPDWDKTWRLAEAVVVAGETKDEARRTQAIDDLKAHAQAMKATSPGWTEPVNNLCRAFEGAPFEKADLDKLDAELANEADQCRCDFQYFFGAAFDQQGRKEDGELYWRKAAFRGPFDYYTATLAGDQLVKRYGPDRGGLPKEYADLEASAEKTNEAAASHSE